MTIRNVREKVAAYLDSISFFEKTAAGPRINFRGIGKQLMRPRVVAPAALAGGAAAMYGIDSTGKKQLDAQAEAAELRQLLNQHPELMTMGLEGAQQQQQQYADPYAQQQQEPYYDPYVLQQMMQQQEQYADPYAQQQQDSYGPYVL